jgi:histidinol-phosphate/aromatic aminotransferase/cobyric acid decarboxylase-like protein
LLHIAAQAYAGPGDEIIYVRYGFSVYDIAARRCGPPPWWRPMPITAPMSMRCWRW